MLDPLHQPPIKRWLALPARRRVRDPCNGPKLQAIEREQQRSEVQLFLAPCSDLKWVTIDQPRKDLLRATAP
jgi:hypothetical protein